MKFARNLLFIGLVSISSLLFAQNQQPSGEWAAVEKALGRSGQAQPARACPKTVSSSFQKRAAMPCDIWPRWISTLI